MSRSEWVAMINVIPSEASAAIDGRLAPGQTKESFLAELRGQIGEELEIEVDQDSPPLEADADGSRTLRECRMVMQAHEILRGVPAWYGL